MTEFDSANEGMLTDEQARAFGVDPAREYGPEEVFTLEQVLEELGPEVKIAYESLKKKDN
jgi:hypothetical protein